MTAETMAGIVDRLQNQMDELAAKVEALEKEIIELKKEKE